MQHISSELNALRSRYQRLRQNGKNIEGQGVMRKIARKIRNLEKELTGGDAK